MFNYIHITLVATTTGIFLLLLFYLFHHLFPHPKPPPGNTSTKPLFNWSDNPSLITDAIENGWSRFAFTDHVSSSSIRSNRFILGSCVNGVNNIIGATKEDVVDNVDLSWEVCHGSADFMQKIRLNSGLKKINKSSTCVVRLSLPLPGPELGSSSSPFPQVAYFEVTIVCYERENGSDGNGRRVNVGEDENVMLIEENDGNVRGVNGKFEELKGRSCLKGIDEGVNEVGVVVSVGLTGGGSLAVKLPGCYPGSVGFHSDGSIYLDGIKLVTESTIERWENTDKVIGCGYNPSQKKVFFTLDSKLVHEISCKGDEYGSPLYPTLATNADVTMLVNFGQSIFKYAPANLQRTQNPCFIGPMANSSSSGYEDSKELFSMGKIDSQWLNQTTRSGPYHGSINKGKIKDYDEASEGDLFEIVIESNSYRRSPMTLS